MEFGLSSEQRMLQDAVARYLAEQSPLRHVRDIAAQFSGQFARRRANASLLRRFG